ncbi:hypothetical protein HYH03_003331 [Edaphochlamys debaryana]|uniref:Tubulin--tyrosine ligase-like protein 5 n=1 Tax=Edaphochlamys debaryana TaxID=47281 RepID=A0A836C3A7_9CHLO|nr:hypothetical protein HYH03_003331 [Edaphochlamys debaryana]|eukprot:KAG2498580.1 hypothetical protein HYH03_003331 [Edaphochlamys debaryana]
MTAATAFRLTLLVAVLSDLSVIALGSNDGAAQAAQPAQNSSRAVRVWLDSVFFSEGELQILKDIADNSSGRLAVAGETRTSFLSVKGAYVPQQWDLYWTVRRACHTVLSAIAPPKRVNCVPGVEAVAYKQPLVRTMQEAYGEAAFDFIPRSYQLPSQYWVWRSWTLTTHSPSDLPWVLKANEHRGRGVRVMRQRQAQRQALQGNSGAVAAGEAETVQKGYVLVQSYVRHQFLYESRPNYLRLWVVVTSVRPLRAYLFRGGVLVFGDRVRAPGGGDPAETRASAAARARRRRGGGAGSGAAGAARDDDGGGRRRQLLPKGPDTPGSADSALEQPELDEVRPLDAHDRQQGVGRTARQLHQAAQGAGAAQASGAATQGAKPAYEMHQVNYWTIEGEKLPPWTLDQLRSHAAAALPSDPGAFDRGWAHARKAVGMVLAAASRRMRTAARGLSALEGCGFEVLGVDFLLNATFHPTLVEVNALPSLARLRTAPGDPARDADAKLAAAEAGSGTRSGSGSGSGSGATATGASAVAGAGATGAGQTSGAAAEGPAEGEVVSPERAAAYAAFDREKERFLEHAIRLVGLPLGPPPVRANNTSAGAAPGGAGGGGAGAGGAGAGPGAAAAPTVGGVLRSMAALLRPPNNDTADLQAFLKTHLPSDFAAAAAAVKAVRHLLCPVPKSWGPAPDWPVLPTAAATTKAGAAGGAAATTAAAAGAAGSGRRLTAAELPVGLAAVAAAAAQPFDWGVAAASAVSSAGGGGGGKRWGGDVLARSRGPWDLERKVPLGQVPRRRLLEAHSGGASTGEEGQGTKSLRQGKTHRAGRAAKGRGAGPGSGVGRQAAAGMQARGQPADSAAEDAAASAAAGVLDEVRRRRSAAAGAVGAGATAAGEEPVRPPWRKRSTEAEAAAAAAGGSGRMLLQAMTAATAATLAAAAAPKSECRKRCFEWEPLHALADTVYELEQDLDFDPIFPQPAALELNSAALAAVRSLAAAVTGPGAAAGDAGGGGAAAGAGANGSGGRMQQLQTGLGFVRESITAVNMDLVRSMKYMTTTPYVLATARLPYSRIDAVLAAFEAVRGRSPAGGLCPTAPSGAAADSKAGAEPLAPAAACAVRLLEAVLEEWCAGEAGKTEAGANPGGAGAAAAAQAA